MFNRINLIPHLRTILYEKNIILKKYKINEVQLMILVELNFHHRINHRSLFDNNKRGVAAGYFYKQKDDLIQRGLIQQFESMAKKKIYFGRTFRNQDLAITENGKQLIQQINNDLSACYYKLNFDK